MTPQEKARETRQQNQEARDELYQERFRATRAARIALQRVFESEDATPAEILEAAHLLVELGK